MATAGKTKLPLNMVFQEIVRERRKDPEHGGAKGLRLIIGELKHLPPKKDIILSVDAVKTAYL
jgi:hypothetical protein